MKENRWKLCMAGSRAAGAARKILAPLLTVCLLLGLLPAGAMALDEPAHTHEGWTAVTMGDTCIKLGGEEQTSNTLPAGSYCLDDDLTVSLTVTGEVSLCLSGHSVTVSSGNAVKVNPDAGLTLWDCAADSTGKLSGTGTSSYGIYNTGTLTLHSGAAEGAYRGVYNGSNSTFTMTGGSVTGGSACGVYNSASSSVFRLSGGSVSGYEYGIYNYYSGSQVYLSGAPSVSGATADIYTDGSTSKIYADDGGSENAAAYSGQTITLAYASHRNGSTAVYHVTEDTKGLFALADDHCELKFAEADNALRVQGKPQALAWYDINGEALTGEGYPASLPYDTYLRTSELPDPPAVAGKLFLGWLYMEDGDPDWSTEYWSGGSITDVTSFKADYIDSFAGSGTESDPYQIATVNHLQNLSTIIDSGLTGYNDSDVWYKLTADIDLSNLCGEGLGSWTPIGSRDHFRANLDGDGRTISNLYINTEGQYQGLFTAIYGGTVRNLTITGWVTAGDYYGGLAGEISDRTVVENVDVTGVTLTPYGHTVDGSRTMAYKIDDDNTIHIQSNYKNNWIQTTYARAGYSVEKANLDGAAVTSSAKFINGGKYVQLSYTITAGGSAVEGGKLAVHADIQIGDNDSAAVEVIQDADGEVIGLKMVDTHSNRPGCLSQDAQFNLYFGDTGGVTPVDTYWFGEFGDRTRTNSTYGKICFAPLNDDTKSSYGTYEQADGVYTRFSDEDSGFAVSWQNIDLGAGQSRTYSFILGVGEKADPPRWGDGNAITLTLAADATQDRRLVNVSARVRDAAGLTDTLYYSVDGGEGQVLGEVEADGSVKAINGQLDLSGCAEGSYLFSFWVVNSKGAASASVERTITITADGIRGLDGWAEVSGVVTDNGAPVADAAVKLVRGREVVRETTSGDNGAYAFANVAPGDYNVVAAKDGKTMTILVKVEAVDLTEQNLAMPGERVNSVLDVRENTPAVVVGGLEAEAASHVEAGRTVTVTMTVEAKEETDESVAADIAKIKEAASGKTLTVLAVTVEKQVDAEEAQPISETSQLLTVIIPFDRTGKENIVVYRCHGDTAQALPTSPNGDGEYFTVGDDAVTVYARKFSTYAVGYVPKRTKPTSGGGFFLLNYTITAAAGEGGGISPSGRVNVQERQDKTFTITPNEGYVIADVLVDGKSVGAAAEYTFEKAAGDHTIEASFQKKAERPEWNPFVDVRAKDWFHDSVKAVYEEGWMLGTDSTHFSPAADTSRAMIATILWRLEGAPASKTRDVYTDCVADSWYIDAVAWAAESGVVKGYGKGLFGPEDPVTREQLALMLWRYAGSPQTGGTLDHFADADMADAWAVDALSWAAEQGILRGKGREKLLDPTGKASRAEAAAMLTRWSSVLFPEQ